MLLFLGHAIKVIQYRWDPLHERGVALNKVVWGMERVNALAFLLMLINSPEPYLLQIHCDLFQFLDSGLVTFNGDNIIPKNGINNHTDIGYL
jgi:vacuolar-type H+-ATPase subunit I/STV1